MLGSLFLIVSHQRRLARTHRVSPSSIENLREASQALQDALGALAGIQERQVTDRPLFCAEHKRTIPGGMPSKCRAIRPSPTIQKLRR